jgi:hypothetical protein
VSTTAPGGRVLRRRAYVVSAGTSVVGTRASPGQLECQLQVGHADNEATPRRSVLIRLLRRSISEHRQKQPKGWKEDILSSCLREQHVLPRLDLNQLTSTQKQSDRDPKRSAFGCYLAVACVRRVIRRIFPRADSHLARSNSLTSIPVPGQRAIAS